MEEALTDREKPFLLAVSDQLLHIVLVPHCTSTSTSTAAAAAAVTGVATAV